MKKALLIQSVQNRLNEFYDRRIAKLSTLDLKKTLRRKNPYLFRAVGLLDANGVIERLSNSIVDQKNDLEAHYE